jgi:hypothetical protein
MSFVRRASHAKPVEQICFPPHVSSNNQTISSQMDCEKKRKLNMTQSHTQCNIP